MWRLCVVRGAACTGLPRRKIGKIIEIVKIRRVQTRVASSAITNSDLFIKKLLFLNDE